MILQVSFLLQLLICVAIAANADVWRSRSIYQVFTDRFARTDGSTTAPCNVNNNDYCGGTWRGLINKLDYIKGMGFTAVWVSPVTSQIDRSYHGYWQNDLYGVNSHFGSVQDLKDLSSELHSKGMLLMVDVVTNHMGWHGDASSIDYSKLRPFTNPSDYNSYCLITDWQNQQQVETCWLGEPSTVLMPDLNTTSPAIRSALNSWITHLVTTYSIDGLRIDSIKNVESSFWSPFRAASNVFSLGELSDGNPAYTYPYSYTSGIDSITDYPLYYALTRVFTQQSPMSDLTYHLDLCKNGGATGCKDSTIMAAFLENHDNARFGALTRDMALARNAIAYVLLGDAIPIIYQGQEVRLFGSDDPGCREALWLSGYDTQAPLYGYIALLNHVRSLAMSATPVENGYPAYGAYQMWALQYTDQVVQLRKDPVRMVLANEGESSAMYDLRTGGMGFMAVEGVVDVVGCDMYVADGEGEVTLKMDRGEPKVLVAERLLSGTGICGF